MAITTLLSQYQLLLMLCDNLSTADILSLGATSKRNHVYIHSSKSTFDKLNSNARCSGKGIDAQAKVFGEWRGDPSTATVRCLGQDARPCSECGVRVCDNCRFHFLPDEADPLRREREEKAIAELEKDYPEIASAMAMHRRHVGHRRASALFFMFNDAPVCEACTPLITPEANDADICRCDFYDHFIGSRWLCVPCFQEEETKILSLPSVVSEVRPDLPGPRYLTPRLCFCGAPPMEPGLEACRSCMRARVFYHGVDAITILKIYFQLGGSSSKHDGPEGIQ